MDKHQRRRAVLRALRSEDNTQPSTIQTLAGDVSGLNKYEAYIALYNLAHGKPSLVTLNPSYDTLNPLRLHNETITAQLSVSSDIADTILYPPEG